jgi:hypothetical protein
MQDEQFSLICGCEVLKKSRIMFQASDEAHMTKRGWGAVVEGKPRDLDQWANTLKAPYDPWVEQHDGKTVLRSASLDELKTANAVRDGALAYIDRVNGAVALSREAGPLRFGGVVEFAPDGKCHHLFAEVVLNEEADFLQATVTGPDGKPVPSSPPQPSEVQEWTTVAEDDDLVNDALIYFGRPKNWFDIYKALECLISRFGGNESAFAKLGWASETEIIRLDVAPAV